MRNRSLLAILITLGVFALVAPASAATVNGVDYILLGKSVIDIEASQPCSNPPAPGEGPCLFIQGNVGVSDTTGSLKTKANNIISATAIGGVASGVAHNLILGSNAEIDACRFDITSGASPASVCGLVQSPPAAPFALPIFAAWVPGTGPLGTVPDEPCVNAATNVTVNTGQVLNLAVGCYKDVKVNPGGTLNLAVGLYKFRNLTVLTSVQGGGQVIGAGSTQTTVRVTQLTSTQDSPSTVLATQVSGVRIETPGSTPNTSSFSVKEFIITGKNTKLDDVILYAPSSAIHLHLGTVGNNVEVVANHITVEPVVITGVKPPECGCFEDVTKAGTTLKLTGGNNLNQATAFFISPTCDTTGATQVNPIGAVTPTDATLDVSGKTCAAPGCHVIAQFTAGTWCSATQTVLP